MLVRWPHQCSRDIRASGNISNQETFRLLQGKQVLLNRRLYQPTDAFIDADLLCYKRLLLDADLLCYKGLLLDADLLCYKRLLLDADLLCYKGLC